MSRTALAIGVGVALAVGCGARAPGQRAPQRVTDGGDPLGARPDQVRAQIAALDQQIDAARGKLGTPAPDAEANAAMASVTADAAAMTCTRSTRDTCTDVCRLGDSICDDAQSICDLAAQLSGDAWAAERCDAGKASCKTASEKCCQC